MTINNFQNCYNPHKKPQKVLGGSDTYLYPSIQEAEAGRALVSSRIAIATQRKPVTKTKTKQNITEGKKRNGRVFSSSLLEFMVGLPEPLPSTGITVMSHSSCVRDYVGAHSKGPSSFCI